VLLGFKRFEGNAFLVLQELGEDGGVVKDNAVGDQAAGMVWAGLFFSLMGRVLSVGCEKRVVSKHPAGRRVKDLSAACR
jgi:hypothetical protein